MTPLAHSTATSPILRVGVVGAGLIAQAAHLPNLLRLPERFELAAIADPSRRRRATLGPRLNAKAYEDWQSMLEREPLDAVLVCSPNPTHAEVTLAALAAGMHVFAEKPLCIDPADGLRILDAQQRSGRVVQVGYMKRFDPAVTTLRSHVAGRNGALRFVNVVTRDPGLARAPFFRPGELVAAEDILIDVTERVAASERQQVRAAVGSDDPEAVKAYSYTYLSCLIHDVNLVHGLLDACGQTAPVRPVTAANWADGRAGSLVQELSNGARWNTTWLLLEATEDFEERVELYFEDAVERLTFPAPYLKQAPTVYERVTGANGLRQARSTCTPADTYLAELEHFHDCICADSDCRTPAAQGAHDVQVLRDLFIRGRCRRIGQANDAAQAGALTP